MKKLILISSLFLVVLITACEKDYYKPAPPLDLNTPVSFTTEVMPIFVAHCYGSGCHDKGIAPKLGTVDEAWDELTMLGYVDTTDAVNSKLYTRMINTSSPMPPKGVLPGENTNKILAWIKQGALKN